MKTMISRLFQFGNGGRTNGTRQAAASANRIAPISSGGNTSVPTLAAALFTPQITTTAIMARISGRVRAWDGGRGGDESWITGGLWHVRNDPSAHIR